MDREPAAITGILTGKLTGKPTGKYGASPLAEHDRAIKTATALLLLEVARESINFELRRQHGYTEGHAAAVIREASAQIPRPARPQPIRRRAR